MSDIVQKDRNGTAKEQAKTKKDLGLSILSAKKAYEQTLIRVRTATSPQQKLQAQAAVVSAKRRLDDLMSTSRTVTGKKRKPTSAPVASTIRVAPEAATQEQRILQLKIAQVERGIEQIKASLAQLRPTDPMRPAKKLVLEKALSAHQAELKALKEKLALAQRNVIVKKPAVVRTPVIPRRPLPAVPAHAPRPTKDDAKKTLQLITHQTPRFPGESRERYRLRLQGLLQRALTRFQLLQSGSATPKAGVTKPDMLPGEEVPKGLAIEEAVRETVATDKPAIDAEASAGGLASDSSTATVETVVEEIANAIDDAVNATPDTTTPEQDLVDAEGEAGELLEEGEQPVDASAVPLYKRPVVIAATAVAMFWFAKRQKWI